MPEMTLTHLAIVVGTLIVGVVVGWAARSNRAGSEKSAINATWREQLEAHARRVEDKVAERKVGWQTRIDAKMRASEEAGEAGLVDSAKS